MTDLSSLINLDARAIRCPYAEYERARTNGVTYDVAAGAWIVSRHADAVQVLRDGATFSSDEVLGRRLPPAADEESNQAPLLLVADDPLHAERRSLVARAFTPRPMRAWEPAVRALCDGLVERMLEREDVDFVRDFAAPLPIRVIMTVLGVPSEEADTFRHWSEEVTRSLGGHDTDPEQRAAASRHFRALVWELLDAADDLEDTSVLSVIATAQREGRLTRYEAARLVMELIVAGNITTTDHLANSMLLLANAPDTYARLRSDRSLVPAFVEESLRLEGPVQAFYRRATKDTVVGGTPVPEGERLLVLYAAANRDPSRYDEPDVLSLTRGSSTGHIAFGFGSHTCLGAPLARMEGRVALEAILDRVEAVEVADPAGVEYLASFINHGPTRLPVRLSSAVGRDREMSLDG